MSLQTTDTTHEKASTDTLSSGHAGRRRLLIALTVLAFLAIGAVALFAISLIEGAVILLLLSALLAYLNYPLVQFLQRRLPPPLDIAVGYLLLAGGLAGERQLQSLIGSLGKFGMSKCQVIQFEYQVLAQAQSALSGLLPFLIVFFSNLITL